MENLLKRQNKRQETTASLLASTDIFIPLKFRASVDTIISMGLLIMTLPFASYRRKKKEVPYILIPLL